MTKILLLGLGRWGVNHLRNLKAMPVELHVAEVDSRRLEPARKLGVPEARLTTNYKEWIDKVDCVAVVTPAQTHFPICREFLEAGYTTLMSAGGAAQPIIALKKAIDTGQMKGPRIIPSTPLQVQNVTPEAAREAIRKMAAADIHFTGEVRVDNVNPDPKELEAIAAAAAIASSSLGSGLTLSTRTSPVK